MSTLDKWKLKNYRPPAILLYIPGKTKLKRNSAEKAKEQPKKSSGTKLYREASLRDLNAYLGQYKHNKCNTYIFRT